MKMYTVKKASMSKEYNEAQVKLFGKASKDPSVKIEHEEWKVKAFDQCDVDKDKRHNLNEFKAY